LTEQHGELEIIRGMIRDHHKRLRDLEEYHHFPEDIGPADHVTDHISIKAANKRKMDIQSQIIKSIIWAVMLFIIGLIGIGAKSWIFSVLNVGTGG